MAFNLDEKYILEAENNLHAQLPWSYKEELKVSNGGSIEIDEEFWEIIPTLK